MVSEQRQALKSIFQNPKYFQNKSPKHQTTKIDVNFCFEGKECFAGFDDVCLVVNQGSGKAVQLVLD